MQTPHTLCIPELLYQILLFVYADPSHNDTLLSCVLVSRDWYRTAHPLLFRDLHVKLRGTMHGPPHSYGRFSGERTVPSAHGTLAEFATFIRSSQHIARSIRRLTLEVLPPFIPSTYSRAERYTICARTLFNTLSRMTSLQDLDMRDVILSTRPRHAYPIQRRLQTLSVLYSYLAGHVAWNDLRRLCGPSLYNAVSTLRITESGVMITAFDFEYHRVHQSDSVYEIRLDTLEIRIDVNSLPSYFPSLVQSLKSVRSHPLRRLQFVVWVESKLLLMSSCD